MENKEELLKELEIKLGKIKRFFNINEILSIEINQKYIDTYYRINRFAYNIFF